MSGASWNSPELITWTAYAIAGLLGLLALLSALASAWEKWLERRYKYWPVERYLGVDTRLWRFIRAHSKALPYLTVIMTLGALVVLFLSVWGSELKGKLGEARILELEVSNEELHLENRAVKTRLAAVQDDIEAAEAHAEAAKAERDAAQQVAERARLAALEARREREKLEAKLKPRVLTDEQRQVIANRLQSTPGTIQIVRTVNNTEQFNFALQLREAIAAGGWKASVGGTTFVYRGIGVMIIVNSKDQAPRSAAYLQNALTCAGVYAPGLISSKQDPGTFKVVVGDNPYGQLLENRPTCRQ